MSDTLVTMRSRLQVAIDALSDSRQDELDDLKFYAGSPDNQWQWPQDVVSNRTATTGQSTGARPCLTINKLPQHVRQITNDQRQNRPAGKVIPVDDKADKEVAEIFDGMVRHIEYISDADVADDTACENQVTFGEGYFRILTEYCDDDSFDQDIRIGRIRNSFSVYMDPTIQDPCGMDAEWCFITEELTTDEYERQWPDAMAVSTLQSMGVGDQGISAWINEKTIRIAEYFYATYEKVKLFDYGDEQPVMEDDPRAQQFQKARIQPLRTRTVNRRKIKWCKTNGFEMLEEQDWPGKWIPVIRVVGNEFEVEGQLILSGIVRNAKDAQRMYNYWVSQEAEMLALAPKSPFIGYGGQFQGYEGQWKTANTVNWPYLEVNPEVTDHDGKVLPLPQRAAPPMLSSGVLQAKMGASDDIKSTTGQYDASLGAEANEKSGKAILARERQTDTGTYHFVDNLARAVRFRTRQIVDLIPKVYNSQRIARIIGLDGETDYAKLDPKQAEPVKKVRDENGAVIETIYNPSVGKYDVCVTTGPSYMTKRQEAVESMGQLLQAAPQLMQIAGDLMVRNMDWPGAEEIADRIKRTIDPKLLDEGDDTPEMAAAKQQINDLQQNLMQMQEVMQAMAQSVEAQEQERENFRAQVDGYKAETERMTALAPALGPEDVQAIVMQTMQQILSAPPLDPPDEGPPQGEMMTEEQPPEGGFFMPEPEGFGFNPNEGMQP
jgi:hypothetical protein